MRKRPYLIPGKIRLEILIALFFAYLGYVSIRFHMREHIGTPSLTTVDPLNIMRKFVDPSTTLRNYNKAINRVLEKHVNRYAKQTILIKQFVITPEGYLGYVRDKTHNTKGVIMIKVDTLSGPTLDYPENLILPLHIINYV